MYAVLMRAGAEVRAKMGSAFALVLLVAVSGSFILGSAAGARRTGDAYARALVAHDMPDAFVIPTPGQQLDLDAVERLPQVRRSARFAFMALGRVTVSGELAFDVYPFAPVSGEIDMGRPVILEGRDADNARADEITVNPALAKRLGVRVGDTLPMAAASPADVRVFIATGAPPPGFRGEHVDLHIVGISASIDEVVQPPEAASESFNLTRAYYAAHAGSELFQGSAVDLERGDGDVAAFQAAVEKLSDQPVPFVIQREVNDKIEGAIRPQAVALLLFGIFVGIVASLVLAQAVGRQVQVDASEHDALRAIGMRRAQLVGLSVVRMTVIGALGAALAVAGAIALSPLAPIGMARRAEPDPGVAVDARVLALGAVALFSLVIARAAAAGWRAASRTAPPQRASRIADVLARARGAAASIGIRMALNPSRGGAPSRGAIAGTAIALAAVAIAFTFGASLQRVEQTPALFGAPWDIEVNGAYGPDLRDRVEPRLADMPEVVGASAVSLGQVTIGGIGVSAFGLDRITGDVEPPLLEGVHPVRPGEIVLGSKTARRIRASVGDEIEVEVGSIRRTLTVSGRAVLPSLGLATSRVFGEASLLSVDGLRRLIPEAPVNVFFVRLRSGFTVEDARARFPSALGVAEDEIGPPGSPAEIGNIAVVDYLPFVLSGMLVVLAIATLAHALVAAGRARAGDMAILRSLGFLRRQVRAAVSWQATTLALTALVFGLPCGLGAGRWLWNLFAGRVGVVAEPVLSAPAAFLAVPIALLAANAVALLPGWVAARRSPAIVLRAE